MPPRCATWLTPELRAAIPFGNCTALQIYASQFALLAPKNITSGHNTPWAIGNPNNAPVPLYLP